MAFVWSMLGSVDRVDDYTVRFSLTEPYAPFLANSLTTFVVPADSVARLDTHRIFHLNTRTPARAVAADAEYATA